MEETIRQIVDAIEHQNLRTDSSDMRAKKADLLRRLRLLLMKLTKPLIRRLVMGPLDVGDARFLKTGVVDPHFGRHGGDLNLDKLAADIGEIYTEIDKQKLSEEQLLKLANNVDTFKKRLR